MIATRDVLVILGIYIYIYLHTKNLDFTCLFFVKRVTARGSKDQPKDSKDVWWSQS